MRSAELHAKATENIKVPGAIFWTDQEPGGDVCGQEWLLTLFLVQPRRPPSLKPTTEDKLRQAYAQRMLNNRRAFEAIVNE